MSDPSAAAAELAGTLVGLSVDEARARATETGVPIAEVGTDDAIRSHAIAIGRVTIEVDADGRVVRAYLK